MMSCCSLARFGVRLSPAIRMGWGLSIMYMFMQILIPMLIFVRVHDCMYEVFPNSFGSHTVFYDNTTNSGLPISGTIYLHLKIVVAFRSLPLVIKTESIAWFLILFGNSTTSVNRV